MEELRLIPSVVWVIVILVLIIQGLWIFNDASKRGMNKWFWGLLGIMNTPTNLIIYLIVSRAIYKTKKCVSCDKNMNKNFEFCPHCGADNTKE